jgi:hypothetical protein
VVNDNNNINGALRLLQFSDRPSVEAITQFTEIDDQFESRVRFRPDGADNIPITIGKITWEWSARADETNGVWSVTASSTNGPAFDDSANDFPIWEKIYPDDL